jgi:hypothetical protein
VDIYAGDSLDVHDHSGTQLVAEISIETKQGEGKGEQKEMTGRMGAPLARGALTAVK